MAQRPSFEQACRQYVHRFTMEHVPLWAQDKVVGGLYYAPQYRTDQEWYENSLFPGEPAYKAFFVGYGHCYSRNQSWPLGTFLDAPYRRQT